jgi:hypothetical protein
MKRLTRIHFPNLRNLLLYVVKRPVLFGIGVLAIILITVLYTASFPPHGKLQKAELAKSTLSHQKAKSSTTTTAKKTQPPTNVATTDTSNIGDTKPPSTTTETKQSSTPSKANNSDLRYALPGIPTVPTIKLQYTNGGGAHYVDIYSYHLKANTYEFIVHPVHSQRFTSNFYAAGYLNNVFSDTNNEPDQLVEGNPNLNEWELSDGDVYTLSVCSYDNGTCGVISSNSVTLTVSVDYTKGMTNYIYNYSQ